jgi:putative metallohydrolase (TIGR04338 family)
MVRDAQRQRVYNAQTGVPKGREWRTIPDMQAYVDRVLASALWRRYFRSISRVTMRPAHWNAKGSMALREATGGTIRLRADDYNQLILFHELAHLAQPPESAGHGPEFCEIYLRMVFHWMGEGPAACLEYGFKVQRVQVAPSATPLRRICLRLHGATQQPNGIVWRRRQPGRSRGDQDS